jgi:GPH family glycoside/pentoside/hexuronide:cation symporter
MTPLLFLAGPPPGLSTIGFTIVIAVAVITVLFYLPSIAFIREKPDIVIPKRSLREETATVMKNPTYLRWIIIVGFLSFSFSAITTQIVGYAQTVLLLTSMEQILPPAIALLVSIIIFLFIWLKAIKKYGKGRMMLYALFLLAVLMALTPFLGTLTGVLSNVIVASLYFIPLAACMAVYYLMKYIVPGDIIQADELASGMSRAGIYEGFMGVPLNIFQAVSAFLLGWFMEYSVTSTGNTLFGYLWWGPLFAPFLLVAAWILRKTDIDPDFEALKAQHGSGDTSGTEESPVTESSENE